MLINAHGYITLLGILGGLKNWGGGSQNRYKKLQNEYGFCSLLNLY